MTDNNYIYQAMFMLENGEVRDQGFNAVRDWVKTTLEKHGADVKVLRLWQESQLQYPIQGNTRATYMLGYLQANQQTVSKAKAEMYLLGPVMRVLFLKEDEVPADEMAHGIAEIRDEDVTIPEEAPELDPFADEPVAEEGDGEGEKAGGEKAEGGKAEGEKAADSDSETAKSES
jgi:ribosomal protein S6